MSYYTCYELQIDSSEIKDMDQFRSCIFEMTPLEEGCSEDSYGIYDTWYGHEEDMRNVSRQFPDVLLTLYGEGEGSGDLWCKYFKAGKMQYAPAEIIYPDFDEIKLE